MAGVMASELGLDPKLARRCGFLHDIGKAADHEVDGPHAVIGARLCKKYGENETVINAVGGHHQDVEPTSALHLPDRGRRRGLGLAARAPGARASRPTCSAWRTWRRIADSFEGVEKSYAIQAGREIRVLVNHTMVSDAEAARAGRGGQPPHRERAGVPGPDQDHGHPGDAGHGRGPLGRTGRKEERMTRTTETLLLKGKPVRDAVFAELKAKVAAAPRRPGPGGGAGGRRSGLGGLRQPQGEGLRRGGLPPRDPPPAGRHARGPSCWR